MYHFIYSPIRLRVASNFGERVGSSVEIHAREELGRRASRGELSHSSLARRNKRLLALAVCSLISVAHQVGPLFTNLA